ncbi:abortive infection family protein [Azospirillum rugosum]|uniref:Abortive infection C-terminus n=1 Tax=Azospirillum rugosum TaxID=416170 RepID=A0ABS4SX08_9PROT|nr:abortive infection family protein [Azospirillum rugosum]MBP2297095.1 hypothetical protein [Azospirillum rugosum]MDQ0530939.1 hypothetical protein [Azospirillum rugosum]
MMSAPEPLPASRLRELIADALHSVKSYQLPGACERLGLAPGTEDDAFRSKRVYVLMRLERLSPASLVAVVQQVLSEYGPNFDLQEAVDTMAEAAARRVSELTRRNIGRALNRFDLSGHVPLLELLRVYFPIDAMPSPTSALDTVADDLDRYTVRNSDWENDQVLGVVGAYECSQRRFFAFLEAVVHPRTRDEWQQRSLVDALNPLLERDGFALMPTGRISGYSVFTVQERASAHQTPADTAISAVLAAFDEASVHDAWSKALERRATHPEGAITSARTLLETVCKHIIEDAGGTYGESDELPKLYRTAATHLNLAPDQHTEEVFKAILGNCQSIVNSLGSVRNKLSDAHGRGRKTARPLPRHAELAVNLAGTMATFLVSTWRARQVSTKP